MDTLFYVDKSIWLNQDSDANCQYCCFSFFLYLLLVLDGVLVRAEMMVMVLMVVV